MKRFMNLINFKTKDKNKNKKKRTNKKKGFTLVELIVVIAIIAILAGALTPSFTGYISEAKKVKVIDQAKNVVTAYESVTAKSPGKLDETSKASVVASSTTLLESTDIDKLSDATVADCIKILDSENNDFELNSDGSFKGFVTVATE